MKQYSEKRVEQTIKLLIQTLTHYWHDTGCVLDEFEDAHDEYECEQSRQYDALVAGHFALKETIDKINKRLNK